MIPEGYEDFLRGLKERIRQAQIRAVLAVNRELVLVYWRIGRDILRRQGQAGWGAKIIERVAKDLRSEFPEMTGFSRTNLLYMRAIAAAWPEESIVQQLVGQIPWGHNVRLLEQVKSQPEREWYIRQTVENGWSRNVLVHQIESGLYKRQGKAISNFQRTLPAPNRNLLSNSSKIPTTLISCRSVLKRKNATWSAASSGTSAIFYWSSVLDFPLSASSIR